MATIPTNNKQPQSARTPFSQTILNSNGYQNILKSYGNGTNAPKKEPPKKEQPKKEPPKKEPKKELTEAEKERAWKKKQKAVEASMLATKATMTIGRVAEVAYMAST